MPTKKNFMGGQQNYDPKTGEYQPSLKGENGEVVTDADGDGIEHEMGVKKAPKEPTRGSTVDSLLDRSANNNYLVSSSCHIIKHRCYDYDWCRH